MKKFLIAAVALLVSLSMSAQLRVTAGYQNGDLKSSDSGFSASVNGNGFYAGILYQMPFSAAVGFEPGVLFDYMKYGEDDLKTSIYFLRVPLHLTYGVEMAPDMTIFGTAGPGLSIGLGGEDDPFGDDGLKRFDIPLGLEVGFRYMSRFDIRVGYDWGLLNMVDEGKLHRNNLHLGVAIAF